MRNYRKYEIWHLGVELCVRIYQITNNFPSEEKFGLISQLRRAVVSISSNISEGSSRKSDKDFARFLEYSLGSLFEVETQLEVSFRLGFLQDEMFQSIMGESDLLGKKINVLISKLS